MFRPRPSMSLVFLSIVSLVTVVGVSTPRATSADLRIPHVLNRLGFGPRPGDIEAVQRIGVEAYLQQQLNPDSIPLPVELTRRLQHLPTLQKNAFTLYQDHNRGTLLAMTGLRKPKDRASQSTAQSAMAMPASSTEQQRNNTIDPALRKMIRDRFNEPLKEATEAKLLRAVYSPRQLEEVMVTFWFNHFNVDAQKERTKIWVGDYERALRPHVFGSFRTLLGVTAKHPAMLQYLDNWRNSNPNSPNKNKRFQGLNENYARELLELHTLGVNGGYTQADVVAVAKVFTGWGFPPNAQWQNYPDGFFFNARRHDNTPQRVLGKSINGQGLAAGEQVLDVLATHPATAKHISYELAQYFVADNPPPTLVDRLTKQFQQSQGNLRSVMTTLIKSPEFWDAKYRGTKFKTPLEYVVSSLRASGVSDFPAQRIENRLNQMGMPLYRWKTPDGYANTEKAWLSASAITQRLDFASAIARGMDRSNPIDPTQLLRTMGGGLSPKTQAAFQAAAPPLKSAVLLGSPEFMRR
jgi:uncharacterized protein (DUF1800 family)